MSEEKKSTGEKEVEDRMMGIIERINMEGQETNERGIGK